MQYARADAADPNSLITLFLCGDVMTGRGIDQVLAVPGDPQLHESYVRDARDYVALAEKANGPIPRPASCTYLWGDALEELQSAAPDLRLINLETSITTSNDPWPGKGIHYRMHPANAGCIAVAGIDVASLANNHVLDWGHAGLAETLEVLGQVGVSGVGAGQDLAAASAPAVKEIAGKGRILVFAFGVTSSGIPRNWGATAGQPGIHLLTDLSRRTAQRVAARIKSEKRERDVVVASIHWGDNWGHDIPDSQAGFAHYLVDQGAVDLIHGHSSHHAKAFEIYKGKLILYGAGDFLNDYEGIGGYKSFRSDLALMYFPTLDPVTGNLVRLKIIPMTVRRFSLHRASRGDAQWVADALNREGSRFGVSVRLNADASLSLD
ncbi:MAG: CapA family protein [Gammaproteobacteria bacterium]|nr:CapA family protein [Gammaproteobacteria bacterium]